MTIRAQGAVFAARDASARVPVRRMPGRDDAIVLMATVLAPAFAQEHASGARPRDACFATIVITSSPGTSPHMVQTGSDSPESPASRPGARQSRVVPLRRLPAKSHDRSVVPGRTPLGNDCGRLGQPHPGRHSLMARRVCMSRDAGQAQCSAQAGGNRRVRLVPIRSMKSCVIGPWRRASFATPRGASIAIVPERMVSCPSRGSPSRFGKHSAPRTSSSPVVSSAIAVRTAST